MSKPTTYSKYSESYLRASRKFRENNRELLNMKARLKYQTNAKYREYKKNRIREIRRIKKQKEKEMEERYDYNDTFEI